MAIEITCDERGCSNEVTDFICPSCLYSKMEDAEEKARAQGYDQGYQEGLDAAENDTSK